MPVLFNISRKRAVRVTIHKLVNLSDTCMIHIVNPAIPDYMSLMHHCHLVCYALHRCHVMADGQRSCAKLFYRIYNQIINYPACYRV